MRALRRWTVALLLALAAGCGDAGPDVTPGPLSAWGTIMRVGQAEQANAPAVWPFDDRTAVAWLGADGAAITHQVRWLASGKMSAIASIELSPVYPREQRLLPAGNGLLLLWLDADNDAVDAGTRLWSALVAVDFTVERGPVQISQQRTERYAALPNGDGSAWVVWSGGLLTEPALYAQYIDAQGRPQFSYRLADDADWPALVRADDGTVVLFWMRASDRRVLRGRFTGTAVEDIGLLPVTAPAERGDLVTGFTAGLDVTHEYLFWNVMRVGGDHESWMASSPIEGQSWSQPARLGISALTDEAYETGFNGGAARLVTAGENGLRWVTPLAGQFSVLAAAAQTGEALWVVYFQAGHLTAGQEVIRLDGDLIGFPALHTDRNRHLYLAWSMPTDAGYADLFLTTTGPG